VTTLSTFFIIDNFSPTVGLWCPDCDLPSMVKYPVTLMGENGVGPAGCWQVCMICEESGEDE
jgi:hypothetical protein